MHSREQNKSLSLVLMVVLWGSLWGIFEATVGYLLHRLEVPIGAFIWCPAACFFMANVYRATRRASAVWLTGVFCAGIKLLNLLLPGRIDRVLNPAVSIVMEALAAAAVVAVLGGLYGARKRNVPGDAAAVLAGNTLWRLLYGLYLLVLVPGWMREISVIASAGARVEFFVVQNLVTGALVLAGYQFRGALLRPVQLAEQKINTLSAGIPPRMIPALQIGAVALLACMHAWLVLAL